MRMFSTALGSVERTFRPELQGSCTKSPEQVVEDKKPARASVFRSLALLLRLSISIGLLTVLVLRIGGDALLEAMERGFERWWLLIPALILPNAVGYLLAVLRLSVLLRVQQIYLSACQALRVLMIGTFFNQLLPTSIGGDAFGVWYIGRKVGRVAEVFSAILMARGLGVIAMCLLATMGFLLHLDWLERAPLRWIFGLLIAAILVSLIMLVFARMSRERADRQRVAPIRKALKVLAAFTEYRSRPAQVTKAMLLSLALQVGIVIQYWLLAKSIGSQLDFSSLLVAVPLVSLAAMLPLSINGAGIREWVMVWLYVPLGVAPADAALISLLFMLAGLLYGLLGGIVWHRTMASEGILPGAQGDAAVADER